uniref:Transmembrane protein n=1 Tax=Ganoderma sp. TQC-2021a TaxID=2816325 RepID=A0A8A5R786_9APHY|nr:hypothetical protein [Ganoderma sp. TQC-2021a]
MIKRKFEILLSYYYKIVKNRTGILSRKHKTLFFILILGIISFFFRVELLNNTSNNVILHYVLLYGSIAYILFIKVNTGFRLVVTFTKGIPFFINEYKTFKKFNYYNLIGFMFYNLILILLSLVVLFRLYSVLSICYSEIYKLIFLYNSIVSFTLCGLYLEQHYNEVTFSMEEVDINKLSLLNKLLILSLPAIIFLNMGNYISIGTQILDYIKTSHTIYCQPDDNVPNVPATNINEQQVLQQNNQNNQNESQTTSNGNVQRVNQVNQQDGAKPVPVFTNNMGNTPFIDRNIFSWYRNSSYGNSYTKTNSQTNN